MSQWKEQILFMIFTIENFNMQLLIWSYLKFLLLRKIAFQQLQGGLYNEIDSCSFELKIFGSEF